MFKLRLDGSVRVVCYLNKREGKSLSRKTVDRKPSRPEDIGMFEELKREW